MPRMKCSSLLAAVALLASLAVGRSASAASITYSDGYASAPIPFGSNPLASLNQFDPSLGTLTSFSLQLVANTDSGQITYTDTSGLPTNIIQLGIGATVTATAPSSITLVAVPLQTGSDPTLPAFGMFTVTGNTGTASDTFGPDSNPGDFGPYVGVGFFPVNVSGDLGHLADHVGWQRQHVAHQRRDQRHGLRHLQLHSGSRARDTLAAGTRFPRLGRCHLGPPPSDRLSQTVPIEDRVTEGRPGWAMPFLWPVSAGRKNRFRQVALPAARGDDGAGWRFPSPRAPG